MAKLVWIRRIKILLIGWIVCNRFLCLALLFSEYFKRSRNLRWEKRIEEMPILWQSLHVYFEWTLWSILRLNALGKYAPAYYYSNLFRSNIASFVYCKTWFLPRTLTGNVLAYCWEGEFVCLGHMPWLLLLLFRSGTNALTYYYLNKPVRFIKLFGLIRETKTE